MLSTAVRCCNSGSLCRRRRTRRRVQGAAQNTLMHRAKHIRCELLTLVQLDCIAYCQRQAEMQNARLAQQESELDCTSTPHSAANTAKDDDIAYPQIIRIVPHLPSKRRPNHLQSGLTSEPPRAHSKGHSQQSTAAQRRSLC